MHTRQEFIDWHENQKKNLQGKIVQLRRDFNVFIVIFSLLSYFSALAANQETAMLSKWWETSLACAFVITAWWCKSKKVEFATEYQKLIDDSQREIENLQTKTW